MSLDREKGKINFGIKASYFKEDFGDEDGSAAEEVDGEMDEDDNADDEEDGEETVAVNEDDEDDGDEEDDAEGDMAGDNEEDTLPYKQDVLQESDEEDDDVTVGRDCALCASSANVCVARDHPTGCASWPSCETESQHSDRCGFWQGLSGNKRF